MNRIRTLIADDEPLARERIYNLISENPEFAIVGECVDGLEAVEAILRLKPDLLFLDVQMPELDGFEVIKEVGVSNMPAVIFITAYDRYALRAFEVYALDYLLKPFENLRFYQALERIKTLLLQSVKNTIDDRLVGLLEQLKPEPKFLQKVLVKTKGRLFFLPTAEIKWIKAEGNYAALHFESSSYLLRETITNLETTLDPEIFLRISRSVIVNINCIKEFHQMFHGDYKVILHDGTSLMLSRRFRDRLPSVVTKT